MNYNRIRFDAPQKEVRLPTLREFRLRRVLSQRELATRAGVVQRTIVEAEAGRQVPHPATMRKLAEALGVAVTDIVAPSSRPSRDPPPSLLPAASRGSEVTAPVRREDMFHGRHHARSKRSRDLCPGQHE